MPQCTGSVGFGGYENIWIEAETQSYGKLRKAKRKIKKMVKNKKKTIKEAGKFMVQQLIHTVQSKSLYISDFHQERRENLN